MTGRKAANLVASVLSRMNDAERVGIQTTLRDRSLTEDQAFDSIKSQATNAIRRQMHAKRVNDATGLNDFFDAFSGAFARR